MASEGEGTLPSTGHVFLLVIGGAMGGAAATALALAAWKRTHPPQPVVGVGILADTSAADAAATYAEAQAAAHRAHRTLDVGGNPTNELALAWVTYGKAGEALKRVVGTTATRDVLRATHDQTFAVVRAVTDEAAARRLL